MSSEYYKAAESYVELETKELNCQGVNWGFSFQFWKNVTVLFKDKLYKELFLYFLRIYFNIVVTNTLAKIGNGDDRKLSVWVFTSPSPATQLPSPLAAANASCPKCLWSFWHIEDISQKSLGHGLGLAWSYE